MLSGVPGFYRYASELNSPSKDLFKEISAAFRSPEFHLGVARKVHVDGNQLPKFDLQALDQREMGPVESIGDSQERGKDLNGALEAGRQAHEFLMFDCRQGPSMIAGDVGDHVDIFSGQPTEIAVFNKIVRVLVMLSGIDVIPHVVQDGGIFEPGPCLLFEVMLPPGLVKQLQGQLGNMERMALWGMAAPSEADHVSAADIGKILLGLQPFAMAGDKVVNDSLPNGFVTERDLL